MSIELKDIYKSLPVLVENAESISWNRFNNFLIFNSILALTWGSIYANLDTEPTNSYAILIIIAVFGVLGGIFFAGLGLRGRKNVFSCLDLGSELEKDIKKGIKVFTNLNTLSKNNPFKYCASVYILSLGPLLFSAFFLFLLYISSTNYPTFQNICMFVGIITILFFWFKIICCVDQKPFKKGESMKYLSIKKECPGFIPVVRKYIEDTSNYFQNYYGSYTDKVFNFLFITNGAGAIAVLSFIGAYKSTEGCGLPLILFSLGIVCVGFLLALAYHRWLNILTDWKEKVKKFYTNEVGWQGLTTFDEGKWSKFFHILSYIFAYGSFILFLSGLFFGGTALLKIQKDGISGNKNAQETILKNTENRDSNPINTTRR